MTRQKTAEQFIDKNVTFLTADAGRPGMSYPRTRQVTATNGDQLVLANGARIDLEDIKAVNGRKITDATKYIAPATAMANTLKAHGFGCGERHEGFQKGTRFSKGIGAQTLLALITDDATMDVICTTAPGLIEWELRGINLDSVPSDVVLAILENAEKSL